jgi:hypothetical protein
MITVRQPITIVGTLAERATLTLSALPLGLRFVATDGVEAVVVGPPNAWQEVQAAPGAVTFAQVKAALAAANSTVSFNSQAIDGLGGVTVLTGNLTVTAGNIGLTAGDLNVALGSVNVLGPAPGTGVHVEHKDLVLGNGDATIGNDLRVTNLISAAGGFPLSAPIWAYNDISASETDVGMRLFGSLELDEMAWHANGLAGSIRSLVIWCRQAVTVGTLSVEVFKNGVVMAAVAATIPVGAKYARVAFVRGAQDYAAGDALDLRYSTSADYEPVPNNDLIGQIEVYENATVP